MRFCIFCALAVACANAAIMPGQLQCEYQQKPEAVQTPQPRFSWIVETKAAAVRGIRQTAYEVSVSGTKDLRGDVWDSGKVQGNRSFQVVYGGKPLKSGAIYFWRVRIWDQSGQASTWSEPAQFRMGLLNPEDWTAKWIAADAAHQASEPLPIFRREFRVAKPVAEAMVYVSGLGQYELRVNGKKISADELTPGWTNYRKTVFYNAYDVIGALQQGANVIGVLVGNGMYNVQKIPGRYTKFVGSFGQPKLIFQLHVTYGDGSSEVVRSDPSWKFHEGPITFSHAYGGEDFDARLEPEGWDKPGFKDDGWFPAVEVGSPGGILRSQENPSPTVMRVYKPVHVNEPKPGVRVYDLGQNFAGWPEVTVRGRAGSTVKLIPGELLDPSGLVTQKASGGPQWFSYILKGGGPERWRPRFSYYGFRYVQVETTGATDRADKPEVLPLQGNFVWANVANAGEFSSSNVLFNRIHALINAAIQSNLQNVLTDCPHREKLGWLEESHLLGLALMYGYDIARLYEKISDDMHDAQTTDGLVPEIAPEYTVFPAPFRDSPEWGSAVVLDPWIMYQHYGDTRNLAEHYDDMKRYVEYLGSKAKDGIIAYGLGDWYDIGPGEPGYSKLTSLGLTATAIYYADITTLRNTALLLGKQNDAAALDKLAQSVRSSFNQHLYKHQEKVYDRGSQTAFAMPLVLGLVPEEDRAAVLTKLVEDIRKHDNHVTAGDIGFHYVVSALLDGGRSDVLYDMLCRTDSPSYGYQLQQGATALTEAWDANPRHSQNHFMLGHAEEWFYRGLAGIDFDLSRPEQEWIRIKPQFVGDVQQASATYKSVLGAITSKWTRNGNKFTLEIVIPANAMSTVYVPRRASQRVRESGRFINRRKDVEAVGSEAEFSVFRVGSGHYQFEAE